MERGTLHRPERSIAWARPVPRRALLLLQFSGTPATGFLGRLGGQGSSPISCCCDEMLSLDCRLEGAPSVPKSCRKWRFSSRFQAFVHYADLAGFWVGVAGHFLFWGFRPYSSGFILPLGGSARAPGWGG